MPTDSLEDLLDRLVAEYSDRLGTIDPPDRREFLRRVPPEQRPGLERCLKMIEAGLAKVPSGQTLLGPGTKLGRYEILREIGRGGMSLVFLARDAELARPVALKVLRPGLALEERHVDRFRREGNAVAKLKHPHVVPVFDVGADQGFHFLAMEYVEGPSLATVIDALPRDRVLTAEDLARATGIPELGMHETNDFEQAAASLLAPVAQALAAAHAAGLVHRDVKPSNVLLHRDGRAVIADFGLAKGEGDAALSLTGDTLGTPYYMSPEQALATEVKVDHRTDVYSLGVTFFELLSQARPFEGETALEVIDAIRRTQPPSLRSVSPARSRQAAAVVRCALQHRPEDRYDSMLDFETDLRALSRGLATRAASDEGGAFGRFRGQLALMTNGYPFEYRSPRKFLGLPLVHINVGPTIPSSKVNHARGWLAIGTVSVGGIAIGAGAAFGGITLAGGASFGLLSLGGGCAIGLLAALGGGFALGTFAMAGTAVGFFLAFGGASFGYAAVGGRARGTYAAGGDAEGDFVLSGQRQDPEAVEFFQDWMPFVLDFFQ